jgi:tRNA (guanine-N7-)-methyltransferase
MFDPHITLPPSGELDWAELFGSQRPVELELGIGKGRFLLESARAHPDVAWFGLELSRKWLLDARRRILKDPPENLRVCVAEAMDFLTRRVPSASLAALHVYHPDPWPKRRHHKRRLITPAFLAEALRCLRPAGQLRISTDHLLYSRRIDEVFAAEPRFRPAPWEDASPNTHFEAKYRKEGRIIYRFRFTVAAKP